MGDGTPNGTAEDGFLLLTNRKTWYDVSIQDSMIKEREYD